MRLSVERRAMDDHNEPKDRTGLVHVGAPVRDVLKEIARRAELRSRLEAERGSPMSDEEFLIIALRSGLDI